MTQPLVETRALTMAEVQDILKSKENMLQVFELEGKVLKRISLATRLNDYNGVPERRFKRKENTVEKGQDAADRTHTALR